MRMFKDAEEAIAFTKEQGVKFVDVRFCDLPGVMQHFNIPVEAFVESAFTDGLAFDGSSIRGFQAIHESDMGLIPDVTSAFVDPFRTQKTLVVNFSIVDPFTDEPYSRDPRNIATKAEAYLRSTGIADTAYFGAEAEFYIFDEIRFGTSQNEAFHHIDSNEAAWNTGRVKRAATRATKPATRVATSRSRRRTRWPTCETRWSAPCRRSVSASSVRTTRWAPPVSRRSTTASPP